MNDFTKTSLENSLPKINIPNGGDGFKRLPRYKLRMCPDGKQKYWIDGHGSIHRVGK